jgi:hypothetical protein
MDFHNYVTQRNRMIVAGKDPRGAQAAKLAKSMTSEEFRRWSASLAFDKIKQKRGREAEDAEAKLAAAIAEQKWVERERPFYNVWPIAMTIAAGVKLDVPFSAITSRFQSILLRFARGHEPNDITTALVYWEFHEGETAKIVGNRHLVLVHIVVSNFLDRPNLRYYFQLDDCVEDWLKRLVADPKGHIPDSPHAQLITHLGNSAEMLIRLVVFIGLLAKGEDLVTPVVLAKDRAKYDSTDDPAVKKWLEDRAARVMGRGFDVGKKLEMERQVSPHWRNPHLALFWTGVGRTVPVIKMRSGAVVQRVSMADVPTGYLGPETAADDVVPDDSPNNGEPVSKSKRFDIMQRDAFRCQLCGKSQNDGVKLHVDHKVPRVNGGSNDDDNLWTLCHICNLGKSDKNL